MFPQKLFIFLTALALTTLACGFTVDLPTTNIKISPTVTEDILVPDPDPSAQSMDVSLSFGAGELIINSGAEALIEGIASYNVEDMKPKVEVTSKSVDLSTGNLEINGIPHFENTMKNTWNLKLSQRPLNLKISAGAYSGQFELGGLALTALRVMDGAADVKLNFAEPNQAVMESFRYETGASSVVLTKLGNANFRSLDFQGGAGSYELDFSGDMQADATVRVDTGLSSLIIRVPNNLNVTVHFDGALTNVDTQGSWGQSGGLYTHSGDGPSLDITIKMGAGSVTLISQ
ncbi:MAG TPA: hypothetical protein DEH22_07405 [Chloroflexi bacterium]|nr:hypothetical protein [Chloroflexota bacterium]